jgi:hypothetical protein
MVVTVQDLKARRRCDEGARFGVALLASCIAHMIYTAMVSKAAMARREAS